MVVQLAVGRVLLLAEVTRDAIERLKIEVGSELYALIKSVSTVDAAMTRSDSGASGTLNQT